MKLRDRKRKRRKIHSQELEDPSTILEYSKLQLSQGGEWFPNTMIKHERVVRVPTPRRNLCVYFVWMIVLNMNY